MGLCFSTTAVFEHLNGEHKGGKAKCLKEAFVLGTGLDADYHKFDENNKVSRKHASVEADFNTKSWWIKDEGSSRGTWVCIGSKERKVEPFPLFPGVMFKIGRVNFNVVDEDIVIAGMKQDGEGSYHQDEDDDVGTGETGQSEAALAPDSEKKGEDDSSKDETVYLKFRIMKDKPAQFLKIDRGYTIGSDPKCDLTIPQDPDNVTEPIHAKIKQVNGKYVIEDNTSSWGTYVKLGSSGAPFELNWNDVILLGYCKMLVKSGPAFTFVKRVDDCCMKAALKCFGVENITLHNSVGVSIGEASLFDRWVKHKESRDKRSDMSELKDWSTSVQMSEMRGNESAPVFTGQADLLKRHSSTKRGSKVAP